jgi:orotate phosphoribosyltransferase
VVVEDLISTGKSSLQAVNALRDAGCEVAGLVAIFSYGFDAAEENFKSAKCPFFTLSNYNALIDYAQKHNFVMEDDLKLLRKWRESPQTWGETIKA